MSVVAQHPRLAEIIARRKLRERIERAVGRLIDALDAIEPDAEAEPWLGAPEPRPTPWAYGVQLVAGIGQERWAEGVNDDCEQEDEHGGDILDEGEEDLGWSANVSQLGLGVNTADGDETAPERHGGGFVRGAPDDHESDGLWPA